MSAITAADYNLYLQTADTSMDSYKTAMIAQAQSIAETYLGVVFSSGTLTERYSVRPGQQTIQLRTYPITSITSIKVFYGSGTSDYNTLDADYYNADLTTGVVSVIGGGQRSLIGVTDQDGYTLPQSIIGQVPGFVPGINNHEIVYVGGAAASAGLKNLLCQAVDYLMGQAGVNPRVASESIGDFSQSFKGDQKTTIAALADIFAPTQSGADLV